MVTKKGRKTNSIKNEVLPDPYSTVTADSKGVEVDVNMDEDTAILLDRNASADTTNGDVDNTTDNNLHNDHTSLLDSMVGSIIQFADDITNNLLSSDEEGAIKEDDVPFERRAEPHHQTNVIHILNLPPEIINDSLLSMISKYREIVKHCYLFNSIELKIVFVSLSIAIEAKRMMDNIKLYNRKIQVIYSKVDEHKLIHKYPDHKTNRHVNMIPAPPSLPPLPPAPLMYPLPPAPPGRARIFEENRSLLRSNFGRNIAKLDGKSLIQLIDEQPMMLSWNENQSMEEKQKEYDRLNEEYSIFNRYLIIGGLPPEVTANITSAELWISKYTPLSIDIEIVKMPTYMPSDVSSDTYLHLTFQKRLDCKSIMNKLLNLGDGIICKYSSPIIALDSLWLGNVTELCGYCKNEDDLANLFKSLGDLKNFRYIPERSCIFVTYSSIDDAVYTRNKLSGLSISKNKLNSINVDFATSETRSQSHKNSRQHTRDHSSQNLGGKLLAAIQKRADGDILIKKLLSDSDADILTTLNSNSEHEIKVDRFGRTLRSNDNIQPWSKGRKRSYLTVRTENVKRPKSAQVTQDDSPVVENAPSGKSTQSLMCKLLKRGKPICNISAVFIRGDQSHKLPYHLDVNQRANPERLKNSLQKAQELSLWQLGADTRDDSVKYDGLCDYLISKGRVALVQEGPYEIYIVPPFNDYISMLSMPDAQFMYAYLMPKGE